LVAIAGRWTPVACLRVRSLGARTGPDQTGVTPARLLPAEPVPPRRGRPGAVHSPEPDPAGSTGRDGWPRRSTRELAIDVACILLAVAFGLVAVKLGQSRPSPQPDALVSADLVAGSLACLALWVRRRWPVALALSLAVISTFSDMATGAVLIALFTVAVHRRWPIVAGVSAAYAVSLSIYYALRPDPVLEYLVVLPSGVVLGAAVVAAGMFVRARRQLVQSLHERAERAESEQQMRVEQARQLERTRIAREMHDVLAHRISLLSLHAGALEFRPDAPAAELAKAAGVIRDSAHQALEDLREVIGVLRQGPDNDPTGRPQPTLADLPALIEESRRAGVVVESEYRVADLALVPTAVGRTAYRIVQEGLTNARKHAPGAAVDVTVDGSPGTGLSIEVRNRPPVGRMQTSAIPGGGTGLVGLRERTSLAGGRLEHGCAQDGDFRLRAWLPWPS